MTEEFSAPFHTTIGDGEIWHDGSPFIRVIVDDQYGHKTFRVSPTDALQLAAALRLAVQSLGYGGRKRSAENAPRTKTVKTDVKTSAPKR